MISLEGRSIIVTGAAQGIGRTVAELVVSLGGNAIMVDRSEAQLIEAANALGDHALPLVGSVTDPAFVTHTLERSVARFGAVHGLVNNAGITRPAMINKMAIEDWNLVIDVNLTAPFMWLQAVGIHRRGRGAGGDRKRVIRCGEVRLVWADQLCGGESRHSWPDDVRREGMGAL
jgi:3-oxoacyl-[acyl-carrier protein] reductase